MPIIRAQTPIVTQINVFTVPEGQQQPLIDHLIQAAQVAREVDGWISVSPHRGLDGTRIINYAQTTDLDVAKRVLEHLKTRGMIEGNKAFGEAHPGLYEVTYALDLSN